MSGRQFHEVPCECGRDCGRQARQAGKHPHLSPECREETRVEGARAQQVRFKKRHGLPLLNPEVPRLCRRSGCGNHYLPKAPNDSYCSDECRSTVKMQRDWAYRNRMRASALARPPKSDEQLDREAAEWLRRNVA